MKGYQVQYENEARIRIKKTRVSKKNIILFSGMFLLIFSIVIGIYTFGHPVEGVWIRQDDDTHVAGMTVEVIKTSGVYEGLIISMPDDAWTFHQGQIKWRDIRKIGFGQYECQSLAGTDEMGYHYPEAKAIITVLDGGNKMTLVHEDNTTSTGKYQVWIKQK